MTVPVVRRAELERRTTAHCPSRHVNSNAFDSAGLETQTDFERMLRIVLADGYHGYVGVEWEGGDVSEVEGVQLTLDLLKRVRRTLALELGEA